MAGLGEERAFKICAVTQTVKTMELIKAKTRGASGDANSRERYDGSDI